MDEGETVSEFKDFLGQTIRLGDLIVYATASGKAKNMTLGRVLTINFKDDGAVKSVQVQPIKSARWSQHRQRDKYIDTRTGKGVDPYSGKHSTGPWKSKETGESATYEDVVVAKKAWEAAQPRTVNNNYSYYARPYYDANLYFDYVGYVYADYISIEKQPIKPVTVTVTENIIRVNNMTEEELEQLFNG